MKIEIKSLSDIDKAAKEFLVANEGKRHFAFYGSMGAGKTTFIKAVCEQLGTTDIVSSPSFAIINEYASAAGRIFHFDFYRIKNLEEAYNLGYEDYFFGDEYCFVEWPEKIEDIMPEHFTTVKITATGDDSRIVEF
ncbi:MAG: tRNA (adenosine(37)-N6)-threonylcarbamoyltransferase complex ATPase subunit type 1 TsaE [Salinivirgaceae bacterium]|nr:tRNA (adenosine(37)-N6)-threonylcarbamoyltransferase complex ATPase subunit type 1 TsaE [Salinivirgaceae bacterium]